MRERKSLEKEDVYCCGGGGGGVNGWHIDYFKRVRVKRKITTLNQHER